MDVDGLDKLCCYFDRVESSGLEYEVIFFIEGENLVAQYVHHIWDEEASGWRDDGVASQAMTVRPQGPELGDGRGRKHPP